MKESKQSSCRVCLRNGENYVSLFGKLDQAPVHDHIMSIAVVNITKDDGFPDRLCPECLVQLQVAITFKKKCEDTDHHLRNLSRQNSNVEIKVKTEIFESNEIQFEQCPPFDYKDEIDQYRPDNTNQFDRSTPLHRSTHYKDEIDQNSPDNTNEFDRSTPFNALLCIQKVEDVILESFIPQQDRDNELIPKPAKGQSFSPQCNECLKYFRSKCKLRVHWKKEHMESMLTCLACKRIFKSIRAFNKHKKTPSRSCYSSVSNSDKFVIVGEGKLRKFQCQECDYTTSLYNHMHTHLVVHMPGHRPFKCKHCSASYTQRGSLHGHIKEKHESEAEACIICSVCGKVLKSSRRLYRHMMRHNDAQIPCPVCNVKFKTKESLKTHMKRHGSKTFQCEFCPTKFYTLSEKCNHRRTVHLPKLVQCRVCEFQCQRKESLVRHESQHGGSKPFPCIKCGKFYESLHHLHVHLKTYHKPKTYSCAFCDKIYTTGKSRINHMRKCHGANSNKNKTPSLILDSVAESIGKQKNELQASQTDCSNQ